MSMYDQEIGKDYASCSDCTATFPTREEMKAHFRETSPNGRRSHSARITNPTREERIESEISNLADDALSALVEAHRVSLGWGARTTSTDAARKFFAFTVEADKPKPHGCESCADCVHDGGKCCGCYDDVCCQPKGGE